MQLIKPSYIIETEINSENILRRIEIAGRTCYKSEDKIGYGSSSKFVKRIINSGHESVIEHESISVRFIVDRGVTHELVRHRLAAFSQECISGDTKIHRRYTIKELYDRQNGSSYDKTHNKTINLKSVNDDGVVIPNKLNHIFYKGLQDVYKVTTKLGYNIKCTMNHKFKDDKSTFKELFSFKVGDSLFVNGRPCLLKISDEKLSSHYLEEKLNPTEISEMYSVPISTVYLKLSKMGIFLKHLNDKNKCKYNKNHTVESYDKMKNTIIEQYQNGRVVWNKDIKENENLSVKKQANSLRRNHYNNGCKEKNSNWNGGAKGNLLGSELKKEIVNCELCNTSNCRLEVHHIDRNIHNNNLTNLLKCCNHCHNLLHHEWYIGKKEILDVIENIDYIGKEETYDIEMKEPYHNYVANGFVVHNSTRYCNYSGGVTFIIPPWVDVKEGVYNSEDYYYEGDTLSAIWFISMENAADDYQNLLKHGWTPQQARTVLPNSLKTEIVMTANLREWRHILKLRTSAAAHPQMREIMNPLLAELTELLPEIFGNLLQEK